MSLTPESLAFFEALCLRQGLRATRYRETILHRRQAACLRALRAACPVAAARLIDRDDAGAMRAFGAVMIGVTAFFRDARIFDALRPLLRPLHERRGRIDALSVGCSDGSELYSLAMLLADERLLRESRLWGLDCRHDAIAAATEGIYSSESVEAVPAEVRARYFATVRGVIQSARFKGASSPVRVVEPIRASCRWLLGDAFNIPVKPGGPTRLDLIMCRNLAIYLTPESAKELWSTLADRLRPGGLLVIGKAERPSAAVCERLTRVGPCIYTKKSEAS